MPSVIGRVFRSDANCSCHFICNVMQARLSCTEVVGKFLAREDGGLSQ